MTSLKNKKRPPTEAFSLYAFLRVPTQRNRARHPNCRCRMPSKVFSGNAWLHLKAHGSRQSSKLTWLHESAGLTTAKAYYWPIENHKSTPEYAKIPKKNRRIVFMFGTSQLWFFSQAFSSYQTPELYAVPKTIPTCKSAPKRNVFALIGLPPRRCTSNNSRTPLPVATFNPCLSACKTEPGFPEPPSTGRTDLRIKRSCSVGDRRMSVKQPGQGDRART